MRQRILSYTVMLCLALAACTKVEKNVQDYYAKVKITEAKAMPDGSLQLTADVDPGRHGIHYAGFCLDTLPHPDISSNQVIAAASAISGNKLTLSYKGLNTAATYYVRGWASNDYGYSATDDITVSNLGLDTNIIPCRPGPETMIIQRPGYDDTEAVSNYSHSAPGYDWQLYAHASNMTLHFIFKKTPVTGIYTVTEGDAQDNYVELWYPNSVGDSRADAGSKIYVQQLDANNLEITLCHASMDGYLYVTARFKCNLH